MHLEVRGASNNKTVKSFHVDVYSNIFDNTITYAN